MKVNVQYFAALREARGVSSETITTDAGNAAALYKELSATYHFSLPLQNVRVAINNDLAEMDQPLSEGDTVVFIPPVAGG